MSFLKAVLALGLLAVTSGSAFAAITVNDLSGLTPLNVSTSPLTGISTAPIDSGGGLAAVVSGGNVAVNEAEKAFIGVGSTVPLGTDLAGFTASGGQSGIFPLSSPSGQYYMPFYQDGTSVPPGGRGYLAFNYDFGTQTLSFVSSTVQDDLGGPLTVVPEPGSLALLTLAGCVLVLRRRKTA